MWCRVKQSVLHGQLGRGSDEGVDPLSVGVQHFPGLVTHGPVVGPGAGLKPEAPHEQVLGNPYRARVFGPAAIGAVPIEVHVPQAVLCRDKPLAKEGIAERTRAHVGDTVTVSINVDFTLQTSQGRRVDDIG